MRSANTFIKKIFPLSAVLLLLILSSGVKPKKSITQIVFGRGGGFTGIYEYTTLKRNCKVYKSDGNGKDTLYLGKVNSKKVQSLFQEAASLYKSGYKLDVPGNVAYFIVLKFKDGSEQRWQWASYFGQDFSKKLIHLDSSLRALKPIRK